MTNIAIIGVGTWGRNYVRVLSELDSANLKLIADPLDTNTKKLSDIYKVKTTKDYQDVLRDKSIQAVCICVPATLHYGIAKDCLNAQKHILIEKPFVLDVGEGEELRELAAQKGLTIMVGHIFRFNPGVLRLKQEIEKGTFGKIRFMYGSRMGLMTPRTDCGVTTDFALHDFDTFCFLLDRYPREVTASYSAYGGAKYEDVGFCTLRFDDNVVANIAVSWLTPKKVRELWIIGEKCSASLNYLTQEIEIYYKGLIPEYNSFGEFKLLTRQEGDDVRLFVPNKEPLKEEIAHFIECVENNHTPRVTAEIGNNIVKIVAAANRSAIEKRTVPVEIQEQ